MIVIDSMMNRSIRFVSVMNAGAARLRFRFPLVAITIGSRDGPAVLFPYSSVAEHPTVNRNVAGSNPAGGAR